MPGLKEVIVSSGPSTGLPYSKGIIANGQVFVSGQLGVDPATGQLSTGGVEGQTKLALESMKQILEAAGSSMDKVVKNTVFLSDIKNFAIMNEEYAKHFSAPFPARSAFQVAALPFGALVEIECIALA